MRPLGRGGAAEALRSSAEAAALKEAGRGCSAQGKEGRSERSGLAGVLTVPAGSSASSIDPAPPVSGGQRLPVLLQRAGKGLPALSCV